MTPPPDKSLTHRALMLAAVAAGRSEVARPLETGDCLSTARCLRALGVGIGRRLEGGAPVAVVDGVGLAGFREPGAVLDAENSGTSLRLLSGLLAGQGWFAVLSGDASLLRRPMGRIVKPLAAMGADIRGREGGRYAPLCFLPGTGRLRGAAVDLPVPSAQVKSSLLLAGLRAEGPLSISGRTDSRDHTERMYRALGLPLEESAGTLTLRPVTSVPAFSMRIPGDLSSAAFFVTAALISGRELAIRGCGLNPTRMGFLDVARRMGARVETVPEGLSLGEPYGTVLVTPGEGLRGCVVEEREVPELIDEAPLIAVLGLFAEGRTEVRGAQELRHKESDRISMVVSMAAALGAAVIPAEDGFSVQGPQALRGGTVDPAGDHRIAMAAAVASAGIRGPVRVLGFEAARVSYPDFAADFRALGGEAE